MADEFTYEPLENDTTIRLIRLRKEVSSTLSFTLSTIDLNSPLRDDTAYLAISYSWVGSEGKEIVQCNGKSLGIPSNAFWALVRVYQDLAKSVARPSDHSADATSDDEFIILSIWIDAVCINQADTFEAKREKETQIPLMRRIFTQAVIVMYDLGNVDPDRHEWELMLFSFISAAKDETGISFQALVDWIQSLSTLSTEEVHRHALDAIERLFQRPWFSRVWILQEVTLPHNNFTFLLLGHLKCHLTAMIFGLLTLETICLDPALPRVPKRRGREWQRGNSFETMLEMRHSKTRPEFSAILNRIRSFEAADPRDLIYGCLGMSDSVNSKFRVDYDENMEGLCRRIVPFLIDEESSVDILYQSKGHLHEKDTTSWSWVPNEPVYDSSIDNRNMSSGKDSIFDACGGREAKFLSLDASILSLEGYEVDAIAHITTSFLDGCSTAVGVCRYWLACVELLQAHGRPGSGKENLEALWRSLMMDEIIFYSYEDDGLTGCDYIPGLNNNKRGSGRRLQSSDVSYFESFLMAMRSRPVFAPNAPLLDESGPSLNFSLRVYTTTAHHNICMTAGGRIAMVPKEARADDRVIVLNGGCRPFLMRLHDDYYSIIGSCYVHGIMDGEAIWGVTPKTIKIF